ncbi:3-hydroxyacyl-CoA dehydrogenase NAD-binding domain-containing protein [Aliiroseovarius subalbicans]|uniref:3-hydroxyacyl-CoA dehydrogenase NAD-binding domain-containing protein n=1 Tax=Aliiroseovarius subalbicans TaxID=2925840 RepID=UPI001F5879FD|nr:3-hydroxyacyl-CoA dehydrogenase NAD-binding domain-containing protein [Aliiroseovarius subalbicans]MCI2398991.1 3-hydroxyacyl-CoA dehydrogenase NAD-binding domain-containing protein [Aliiroseovarius subalbicans]
MNNQVKFEVEGNVAILTIQNPPVNALGAAVRQGLFDGIEKADGMSSVNAVLIRAAGRTFPAGADVREFGKPRAEPILSQVVGRIEACSKPVVAAVHGNALGGGFEIALGAHYRMASRDAKFGLPEVLLGVLPGAGGTQRVPRLTGAAAALDLMLVGKPIGALQASDLGLVDALVDGDVAKAGFAFAQDLAEKGAGPRRTCDRRDGFSDAESYMAAIAARRLAVAKSPLEAPARIVDCVEAAMLLPFEAGIAKERAAFDDCEGSEGAQALRHAFFAERRAAKVPELEGANLREVNTIGVVGAGTMGTGIAVACLDAGFPVTLVERDEEGLLRGVEKIDAIYQRSLDKGRIDVDTRAARMEALTGTTDMDELAQVDLVIEAVFEEISVKEGVFAQLDAVMKPGAILATNTSYLDINALAATISRPQDVVGYHFFSPANIMKLLEIVVADRTDPDVVATGFALAKRLRKVPVRAGVADGFIGNRILAAYRQAADFMLEDGATPAKIDAAMRDFGFPIGPYQVLDMAGLDISWARRKRLADSRDPAARYVAIGDKLCERGWFGQKAGRGYYIYEDGSRTGVEDPEVLAIIEEERAAKGISPRRFSAREIQHRCLNAMANEGARLLEEAVALRPSDIDVVMFYGYGFPRWRGGPMMAADLRGLLEVENELRSYQIEEPAFWAPSPLFDELVKNGQHFEDLNEG